MKRKKFARQLPLYVMLLPGVIIVSIYAYAPMVGIGIAFQKFLPAKGLFGSEWVGLENFRYMMNMPTIYKVIWNTIYIALMKIVAGIIVPVTIALLLNEVRSRAFKRSVQTIVYLPHFLSWVIISGVLIDILSPSEGIINHIIKNTGRQTGFLFGE